MSKNNPPGFATRAIHVGQEPDLESGAISAPIHPTSTYVQQEIGVAIEQNKLVVPLVHPAVADRSLAMLDGVEYIPFDFDAPAVGAGALMSSLQAIGARAEQRQQQLELAAQRRQELVTALLVAGAVLTLVALATAEPA